MKLSARNQIKGRIISVTRGATTSHVRLDVGGGTIITAHPWVVPVGACDLRGKPLNESNLGHSIGRRGLLAAAVARVE